MVIMKKIKSMLFAALACVGLVVPAVIAAPAQADGCGNGNWSVVIGGLAASLDGGTWQTSSYLYGDERIEYNSANAIEGLDRLRFVMSVHRDVCPGDHIKIVAHSGGAGIAHQWIIENSWFPNANAILLADPKMHEWPGGDGFSRELWWMGYPMAGNDDWFGDFPTLTVCNWNDHICRADSDWTGYLTGAHTVYITDADYYGDWEDGAFYF